MIFYSINYKYMFVIMELSDLVDIPSLFDVIQEGIYIYANKYTF